MIRRILLCWLSLFTASLASEPKEAPKVLEQGMWSATEGGFTARFKGQIEPWLTYVSKPTESSMGLPERFRHEAYFHPIITPKGKMVSQDYPSDHLWQRGLWMAYTRVAFQNEVYDFWNQGAQPEVRAKIENASGDITQHGVCLEVEHHWKIRPSTSPESKESLLLKEQWRAIPARTAQGHVLLLEVTQTNATNERITFPSYHYGGLGLRTPFAETAPSAWDARTSEQQDRITGNAQPARWVWLGLPKQGPGVLVIQHPENFRYPTPVRLNPKQAQLSVAPAIAGEWHLEPREALSLRFAIAISDEPFNSAHIEQWHQAIEKYSFFETISSRVKDVKGR